ncbi:hypothetical protein [Bacteroides acidifaciens]|uniref:hypothetical protein n=1 Tax=Bacteroides acidifaciens TaxID=85831 RepID=UPI0025A9DBE1|nr:hypothetical protein [Bacteroides acidifaciens]
MPVTIEFKASASKDDRFKYQMAKDFRKFSRQELAKECRRYFDMANKRINRLESSKVLSPALHAVLNSGGKFYAKGADLKQLQHEYARCINFLNMGTSTVTTARQYERTIAEKLGGHKLSTDQKSLLFKAFRTIEKTSPAGVQAYGSDRLIQYLADEIDSEDENIMKGVGSQDWDAMIEKVIADMSVEYEKRMDEFYNSFKDIFSI